MKTDLLQSARQSGGGTRLALTAVVSSVFVLLCLGSWAGVLLPRPGMDTPSDGVPLRDVAPQFPIAATSAEPPATAAQPLITTAAPQLPFCKKPQLALRSAEVPLRYLQPHYSGITLKELLPQQAAVCELMLLSLPVCCVSSAEEDVHGCIGRVGWPALDRRLPSRCRTSAWWKAQRENATRTPSGVDPAAVRPVRDDDLTSYPDLFQHQVDWQATLGAQQQTGATPKAIQRVTRTDVREFLPFQQNTASAVAQCADSGNVSSIFFGGPRSNGVPTAHGVSRFKIFEFSPLIPLGGDRFDHASYALNEHDEWFSMLIYRYSYFAVTHRRGGWDCLRHYEQLLAGAVPLMHDLTRCNERCMTHMPKALLKRALFLPAVRHLWGDALVFVGEGGATTDCRSGSEQPIPFIFELGGSNPPEGFFDTLNSSYITADPTSHGKKTLFVRPARAEWSLFDEAAYFALADEILAYSRAHLTTEAMMSHVFATMGFVNAPPKRVLLISQEHDDYMQLAMESGLNGLGVPYTSTNTRHHQQQEVLPGVIEDATAAQTLEIAPISMHALEMRRARPGQPGQYAMGYGYSRRTRRRERLNPNDATQVARLESDLRTGEYDAVLIGWLTHTDPVYKLVRTHVSGSRIAMFNGADNDQQCWYSEWMQRAGFHVFYRELW